ncbi:FxSxx-COOH system tetratricopeptide repeat protein [Streptomyces sp. NPDC047967]|uniref:FxSxx-COOH system tetratricopeptide repeat protein n=1 Tax=Streptomyces sp. NPDC047967 TaxID=3154924 RepID=UPI0033C4321A
MSHNAVGPGSTVVDNRQTHFHHAPRKVSWPLEVGSIPNLATAFQPRSALRDQVNVARARGSAAVLTQVLSGGGGVGKSQLAAAYAAEAIHDGTDLVLWANAVEVQQVITLYAQAAVLISVPGATSEDPAEDARAFLAWLATTGRRWLVVLDDITDPAGMSGWWPASRAGTGWVLATTRLHDASLTGNGRRRIRVDVYTPDEAASYLRKRLSDDDAEYLLDDAVDELAAVLGYLPLALGHAAAYMLNQDLTCTQYLDRFNDRTRPLGQLLPEEADAEGYGRQITATLLLSLDAAQQTEPVGLARPALELAALFDPAGHPLALWNTPAVLSYLAKRRSVPAGDAQTRETATPEQADAVLRVLHRYALINSDRRQKSQAVRIHALTARAIREGTPVAAAPHLARAAADALVQVWPDPDQPHPHLAAVLRSNADHLHRHTDDALWLPDGHLVLYRAGRSLADAGLSAAAIEHWEKLAAVSHRIHGDDHRDTLLIRGNLATAFFEARRTDEAIGLSESVLRDRERVLDADHPDVTNARANLAASYQRAGRHDEAIPLQEAVLALRERVLGFRHPLTVLIRSNLAASYEQAGRADEAITLQEAVLADRERTIGSQHPETLTARSNLAMFYGKIGRLTEAISLQKRVLTDRERVLGPQHPHTVSSRGILAMLYGKAGSFHEAIPLQESVLASQESTYGFHDMYTLATRNNLAVSYWRVGRAEESIPLAESVLTDYERKLGSQHPHTLAARENLAGFRRARSDM